jgi:hypothetical protein
MITTPMTTKTTGTSQWPQRSTTAITRRCDPSQDAARHQTATSTANTATATAVPDTPMVRNIGV